MDGTGSKSVKSLISYYKPDYLCFFACLLVFESDEYFYKVVYEQDDIRTFYEAEEFCSEFENGHLASINSPAENEWLHRKIQSIGHLKKPGRFWVGASDRRHFGSFEWLDGKPFVFHAAHYMGARNPRRKQDYEMCLSMTSSRKDVFWNEDDCYNARGYICKTEGWFFEIIRPYV